MKKLLTLLLLIFSQYCSAQSFGARDFLLTQKLQNFELIGHFLIKYHNFHYSSDISEGNCSGYQFKKTSQRLDVMRCLDTLNSNETYKFVLLYTIPKTEFSDFQNSLIDANYNIYSVTTTANGHKVTMYTLKSTGKISAFFIEESDEFYEITGA